MYLSKALYQQFVGTIYMLQYMYALFFAVVGSDKLFQFLGVNWESYLSAVAVQIAPVEGSVLLVIIAIVQLVIAAMLLIPGIARIGAYAALCILLLLAADVLLANFDEFFVRAVLYAMMAIGALALIRLQSIHSQLQS